MNRFKSDIKEILEDKRISRFRIFASVDTWGKQAEYIRFGLNIKEFERNIRIFIKEIPEGLLIHFIVTVNALSIFSLKEFLEKFLEWQKEDFYLYKTNYRRIFVDLRYLRFPAWQTLSVLPEEMVVPYFENCLDFMKKNRTDIDRGKYYGFGNFSINKMRRLIDISKQKTDRKQQALNRIDFYRFFNEYDRRKQLNFVETFPELKDFWKKCKKLNRRYKRSGERSLRYTDLV